MPELPEVETTRRTVEKLLKGKRLEHVWPDPDDRIVYDRDSPEEFQAALEGARVTGSGRRGKYFWLELDRRPWPVFHLGMTGNIEVRRGSGRFAKAWGGPKLWSEGKRDRELEKRVLPYCRLRLLTKDGTEVAFTDPRRFGRIRLAKDPLREPPISNLGFDPLVDFPTAQELEAILKKRRAPLKAVLLDQGVFAGVGNWIADEVLFQSKLSPHRLAAKLSLAEVATLRRKILAVVKLSVQVRADYEKYPKGWLFHYRWGREKGAKTSQKHAIQHETVGGRTTAWVPALQK